MAAHPLALLFSAEDSLCATRVPFLVDLDDGRPARLRAHLNGNNPQAATLDGSRVLVVFSGPASYVSPNWRANKDRGGTYDFEQVTVRGTARVVTGESHFRRMIDDLSALASSGVDYVSVGALTKHLRAMDLSLRIVEEPGS